MCLGRIFLEQNTILKKCDTFLGFVKSLQFEDTILQFRLEAEH